MKKKEEKYYPRPTLVQNMNKQSASREKPRGTDLSCVLNPLPIAKVETHGNANQTN